MADSRAERRLECARTVINTCLGVKPDEKLCIVTDDRQDHRNIEPFFTACREAGIEPVVATMFQRRFPGEEPPELLARTLKDADAVLVWSTQSITYSQALARARESGTRVLIAVGVTEEMMVTSLIADYAALERRARALRQLMLDSREAVITSPLGTHLTMRIKPAQVGLLVDGLALGPGEADWLPAGSAHVVPEVGSAEGKLVVNGSLNPMGRLAAPVELTVRDGYIKEISGGAEAETYRSFLAALDDPNVYNIGELGLGCNPAAEFIGLPVQDERVEGGILVGIGQNVLHGGNVRAKTHTDAIMLGGSLTLDGKTVVDRGRLVAV